MFNQADKIIGKRANEGLEYLNAHGLREGVWFTCNKYGRIKSVEHTIYYEDMVYCVSVSKHGQKLIYEGRDCEPSIDFDSDL